MFRKVFGLVLVMALLAPVAGHAMDMTGKWGLGYFSDVAPVGARYWINDKLGIDFGIGYKGVDLNYVGIDKTATNFWLEAGFPYVVYGSDRANFFIRPGIVFASLDDRVYGHWGTDKTYTDVIVKLSPGAEVFFGNHFSLEAAHGIMIQSITPPDPNNTETNWGTESLSITNIGFHFYFK